MGGLLSKRWEMALLLLRYILHPTKAFTNKHNFQMFVYFFDLFSGIALVYTLRVNMSVAAQKMRHELDWSEGEKGLVLVSLLLLFESVLNFHIKSAVLYHSLPFIGDMLLDKFQHRY